MRLRGITRNVVVLGFVSFFNDIASEMLYPVIPLFLNGTLGATPELMGLIEGIAEGGTSILRWLTGALSDRFGQRKPFIIAGYGLSALSKPVMGLSATAVGWPLFLLGRSSDRLGKSLRTSARDALIADSTDAQYRGVAYGLHQAMDTCGAILGPLLALAIVVMLPALPLDRLFYIAFIPGMISLLLTWLAVRDIPHKPDPKAKPAAILQRFTPSFWQMMVATTLFSFGCSSDTFLILRCHDLGLTFSKVILAYTVYNVVIALSATWLGSLSDRIGRKPVIAVGWIIYAIVYLGFSIATSAWMPWVLWGVYGVYQALTDGVTKAMIADVVPKEQRAGAIGFYYTLTGLAQLCASLIAGALWHSRWFQGSVLPTFFVGAIFAAAAVPLIITTRIARPVQTQS